jgi:hypothetical protein
MDSAIVQHATSGWETPALCIQTALNQWKLLFVPTFLAYFFLASLLRFRRAKGLYRRYSHLTKDAFSRMTVDEAFAIHNDLVQLEFPRVVSTATAFALFKVCSLLLSPRSKETLAPSLQ